MTSKSSPLPTFENVETTNQEIELENDHSDGDYEEETLNQPQVKRIGSIPLLCVQTFALFRKNLILLVGSHPPPNDNSRPFILFNIINNFN